jgi:hypothetical protein
VRMRMVGGWCKCIGRCRCLCALCVLKGRKRCAAARTAVGVVRCALWQANRSCYRRVIYRGGRFPRRADRGWDGFQGCGQQWITEGEKKAQIIQVAGRRIRIAVYLRCRLSSVAAEKQEQNPLPTERQVLFCLAQDSQTRLAERRCRAGSNSRANSQQYQCSAAATATPAIQSLGKRGARVVTRPVVEYVCGRQVVYVPPALVCTGSVWGWTVQDGAHAVRAQQARRLLNQRRVLAADLVERVSCHTPRTKPGPAQQTRTPLGKGSEKPVVSEPWRGGRRCRVVVVVSGW